MACTAGLLAEDCATDHWSPALGARREVAGWRAPCPVCRSERALEYDTPKRSVRWRIWCACERETVRKALADLLPSCMPGRRSKVIDPATLEALALSSLHETALKVVLLEMSGMTTTTALDALGTDRTTRYRVRRQVSHWRDKTAGR